MSLWTSSAVRELDKARGGALGGRIALTLLAAAVAIFITDTFFPVAWAAVVVALDAADSGLLWRLARESAAPAKRTAAGLAAWNALVGAANTALPVALWLHGSMAAIAAATMLWCAFLLRSLWDSARISPIALSVAAPHGVAMIATPIASALVGRGDIGEQAVIVGAALLFLLHVTVFWLRDHASALRLQRALAEARHAGDMAKLLFEQANFSALLLDRDLRVVAMSQRYRQTFKLDPRQARGKLFFELVASAPPHWRAAHLRALRGETVAYDQDMVVLPDGRQIYSRWECSPWRNFEGEIAGTVIYATEVTAFVQERKDKEAAATRLSLALEITGAAIWEMDFTNQKLIGADQLGAVFGVTPTFEDVFRLTPIIVHPDDRRALRAASEEAMRNGARYQVEHRVLMPSGEVKWVNTFGEVSRDEDGAMRGLVCLTIDVTARKRAETGFIDAMRKAERALEEKRTLMAAIARDIGSSAPAPSAALLAAPAASVEAGAGFEELYARLARLLAEIDARDDALVEAVHALRDARIAAEGASVAKSQFLANMSHELRTPLNAVIGYAEILEEDLAEAARSVTSLVASAQDAGRIRASARHLLALINEILDLSKIEAGKMELTPSDTDVGGLVRETVDTVQPLADGKLTILQVDLAPDLPPLRADPMRLRQCLLNLLSNACKFTKNGAVRLTVRREERDQGAWMVFDVADTGIGMSQEQVGRLFQAFVQAETDTAQKYGGTGLGLALTRRIARLMGGDVTVVSAQGRGSTFSLALPILTGETIGQDGAFGGRPVVLVIEEDPAGRDAARQALSRLGFAIAYAADGKEGAAAAARLKPAIVLLDLGLAGAWDALARLREENDAPVLTISSDADRARALGQGACEHLAKPFDRAQLAAAAVRFARFAASPAAPAKAEPLAPPAAKARPT